MKAYTIIFILIFLNGLSLQAQKDNYKKNILGKWEGIDKQKNFGRLEFLDTANALMITKNQPPIAYTYTIDFSKNPGLLDLIEKNKQKGIVKCLLQFQDVNLIKIQVFKNQRPSDFVQDSLSPSILLKRKN